MKSQKKKGRVQKNLILVQDLGFLLILKTLNLAKIRQSTKKSFFVFGMNNANVGKK